MSARIEFEFEPAAYVTVTLLGLNYPGRILRCLWSADYTAYEVQYADDKGELRRGEFFSDELSPSLAPPLKR